MLFWKNKKTREFFITFKILSFYTIELPKNKIIQKPVYDKLFCYSKNEKMEMK
jgi:hypothetical protein